MIAALPVPGTAAAAMAPPRPATGAVLSSCIVIAVLVAVNVGEHLLRSGAWLGAAGAAVLVVFARWRGLSWAQLGMSRERLRPGARVALGAVALIAVVYAVALLLPPIRSLLLDARYRLPLGEAMVSAFVIIPVGTVLAEEIAFRSVLWGMLARHTTSRWVLVASSVLFGLWHILPSLHLASANRGVGDAVRGTGTSAAVVVVVATVVFTALGGVVAGELRRRSGSVVASIGMHWAANGLGVLFGVLAWRLVG